MRRSTTQQAVTLAGVLALVATTVLPLQPVFGAGGGARRDVVLQEEQNLKDAIEHDGHDVTGLEELLDVHRPLDAAPRVVLAQTIFGRGVSFMERQIAWHYLPLDDAQFAQALAELEARA